MEFESCEVEMES